MDNKSAIKPNYNFALSFDAAPVESDKEKVSEEAKRLDSMANSSGWKILKDYKDELLKSLDKVNDAAIANGSPLDEIGRNTVVINLAKSVVNRLFERVSDAEEAVEKSQTK